MKGPRFAVQRLRAFGRWSRNERSAFFSALFALAATRVLLSVLPYRIVRAALQRRARRNLRFSIPEVSTSIRRASRAVPFANCLVQAIAAEWLINRCGRAATLRVGVVKDGARLHAHAWLVSDGETIVGGERADEFTPLV